MGLTYIPFHPQIRVYEIVNIVGAVSAVAELIPFLDIIKIFSQPFISLHFAYFFADSGC